MVDLEQGSNKAQGKKSIDVITTDIVVHTHTSGSDSRTLLRRRVATISLRHTDSAAATFERHQVTLTDLLERFQRVLHLLVTSVKVGEGAFRAAQVLGGLVALPDCVSERRRR